MKNRFVNYLPGLFLPLLLLCAGFSGCASLFGWDIHAPGILSENYFQKISPLSHRTALYLEPSVWDYVSKNRGGRFADPQTYHIGESYVPMVIEGFQNGFEEFVFFETEPTAAMMQQYGIHYLAVVRISSFGNDVTMKGQAVSLKTKTLLYGQGLDLLSQFESIGSSDAQKIFAKKGGPEVNLNAALENNVISLVQYVHDYVRSREVPA